MAVEDIIADLKAMTASEFNRKRLFNSRAWYFEANPNGTLQGDYDDFCGLLAQVLNVNPRNLAIVGSAKFGVSLAPPKKFKPFDATSDIDVVVVDQSWFEEIWKHLREADLNGYGDAKKEYAREIFHKYICLKPDHHFDTNYLREVIKKTDDIKRRVATPLGIVHPITYRVYAHWSDVSAYHLMSTQRLKDSLP